MINRYAVAIDRRKCDDVVFHALGEITERIELRARRQARIDDPVAPVQHHTAGPFQIMARFFVRAEIDNLRHLEATLTGKTFDNVGTALGSPILGLHWVENNSAVGMKAHPVIGENRVGCMRFMRVINHHHVDTRCAQRTRKIIELVQSRLLLFIGRRTRAPLKQVGLSGQRVALKSRRANHENR